MQWSEVNLIFSIIPLFISTMVRMLLALCFVDAFPWVAQRIIIILFTCYNLYIMWRVWSLIHPVLCSSADMWYLPPIVCGFFLLLIPAWVTIARHSPSIREVLKSGWQPVILAMSISRWAHLWPCHCLSLQCPVQTYTHGMLSSLQYWWSDSGQDCEQSKLWRHGNVHTSDQRWVKDKLTTSWSHTLRCITWLSSWATDFKFRLGCLTEKTDHWSLASCTVLLST